MKKNEFESKLTTDIAEHFKHDFVCIAGSVLCLGYAHFHFRLDLNDYFKGFRYDSINNEDICTLEDYRRHFTTIYHMIIKMHTDDFAIGTMGSIY